MKAEIVSIGTELLLGSITDTNATYLAQRLAALGINCYFVSQVGDNQSRIVATLRRAWNRSDLVITTGGLGPTGDDLTRESIAEMLGEETYVVPELEDKLRTFFEKRGVPMPESNIKQAFLIPSADTLSNPVGTAPGWIVRRDTNNGPRIIVSMPGVPYEMKRMWELEVEPLLRPLCPDQIVSRTLKILGVGESAIDQIAADLMLGSNPTLAPYAKNDGVHLRISAKAPTEGEARAMITPVEDELRSRLGDAIYGADDDSPAEVVDALMRRTGIRLGLLEVGKGAVGAVSGLLAGSEAYAGGVTAHSLEHASAILDLDEGALSPVALAQQLLAKSGTHVVLAVISHQGPAARPNSVQADIETFLVFSHKFAMTETVTTKASWTTASGEVPRLAGLAALNSLRKWLLSYEATGAAHV